MASRPLARALRLCWQTDALSPLCRLLCLKVALDSERKLSFLRRRQVSAAVEETTGLTSATLTGTALALAGLSGAVLAGSTWSAAPARDASGARTAGGSLLDKVLVVASTVTAPTRVAVPAVGAPASVGAPTVPIVPVAALVILPAAVFFAGLRDELAKGIFGTFIEASVGGVGVAVLDPWSGRFGFSAIRVFSLGEGSLVRGLLLLLVAGATYKGSRDEPGEDQERQDAQNRRDDLVVAQQAVSDAGDHRRYAAPGGSALGVE
jgi:hypothetical protein